MKLSLCIFSVLWVIPVFAASPKAVKLVKDEERIQGTWTVLSFRDGGKELSKQELAQVRFVITEKRISFGKIGQERMGFNYTLDSTKTPKAIDTTHELDPGKPIVQLGIYAFEGETLKLSFASAGMSRPKDFDEKTATTSILKRVKGPEKKPKP